MTKAALAGIFAALALAAALLLAHPARSHECVPADYRAYVDAVTDCVDRMAKRLTSAERHHRSLHDPPAVRHAERDMAAAGPGAAPVKKLLESIWQYALLIVGLLLSGAAICGLRGGLEAI